MVNFEKLKDKIIQKMENKQQKLISESEAYDLINISSSEINDLLFLANKVREQYIGDEISLCSIVNAKSGYCSEDCSFCAQSKHNKTNIDKYPMLKSKEILKAALKVEKTGAQHFGIVTSGHKLSTKDFEIIQKAVKQIVDKTNLNVCASLGILSVDQLKILKSAGLYKYHHNLETSESFFHQICTSHNYSEREEMVKRVKSVGLNVCSGGILGLGEQLKHRVELALILAKLDVDSIPINILVPIPGTPLAKQPSLEPIEILKTIAIFRLLNPDKVIKLAGGREVNLGEQQSKVLTSGANGLMIGNYLTMPGQRPEDDINMIKDLGLIPGKINKN